MAEEDESRFDVISDRAEKLIGMLGRPEIEALIDGLDRMEVAAVTAALHPQTDFILWAAYKRRERAKEQGQKGG